ncbi:MAG: DUF5689 domain-containing protein [Flavobacteriaceae bacterium]|nr:DUF5689 domain-containing protein [Flavobacteriaceae bacterium]
MKKIIQLILLILIVSCTKTENFDVPKIEIEAPNIFANSNIIAIKNAHKQLGENIYTFNADDTTIIEGFVISSDEAGNFYKTLIIQDNYKNPTSGIEILIDFKASFTKFNFGRKVFVKMAGLSIVNNEGKYKIGFIIKNKVKEIPETLIDNFIIRSIQTKQIISKPITLANFTEEQLNTYVQIKNLQFKNDEIGKTFAGEKFDRFNGERVLVQCDNQITTLLSTSTFSNFKSNLLSHKKGQLSAVLTKDFSAKKYVLILNDLSTFDFTENQRCDPQFLNCENNITKEPKLIFFENFQEIKKTKDLEDLGWTNTNTYLGNGKFKKRSSKGNISMQISAFNTNENPLEAWLITPPINLDNSSNEILTFDTKASFDSGSILTAWVSTDFNKNIQEATWQQLSVKISVGARSTYVNDYISSGDISLNCLEGNVFIALRYLGADPGISTTYDVDNFKISGN